MNDFEVLEKYIKEFNLSNELNKLTYPEQVLYKCQLRDTLSFNLYLATYRILEFAKKVCRVTKEIMEGGVEE